MELKKEIENCFSKIRISKTIPENIDEKIKKVSGLEVTLVLRSSDHRAAILKCEDDNPYYVYYDKKNKLFKVKII